ncbi:hypothetical protein [Sandaracinus amylolyticus]|uniref:Uncharacterized protein n=1 Tax=Sandaracinus amylolyticus TaxID=927083 RepID=A0A0F6VZV1_9BACT|nr:hypothetical protein [Sandaracinus amylolyticus]AKF03875.1 hypothetical protein DB32_001024 [Sandaracinus amylolyticus]
MLGAPVDVPDGIGFNRIVVRNAVRFSVLALALAACATGAEVSPRGQDGGRRDAARAGDAGVCDPPCGTSETCVAGSCVPVADFDDDGIDASVDCDDDDPTVSSTAQRDCEGACGPGLQRCEDGVWSACDAPASCDCTPGSAPRTVACARCGTQRQVCVDGSWTNDGDCMDAGECSPGDVDTGGGCGNCGTQRRTCSDACTWSAFACEGEGVCAPGTTTSESQSCACGSQTRTRTCASSCTWGEFGAWGACTGGAGSCTPGTTESRTVPCGNCGTQMQARTCSSGCAWGTWTNVGGCAGEGVCAPGSRSACSPTDACGERVCNGSCGWGACQPVAGAECLHRNGTNFRSCSLSSGGTGRQYCLPPVYGCAWSDMCAP